MAVIVGRLIEKRYRFFLLFFNVRVHIHIQIAFRQNFRLMALLRIYEIVHQADVQQVAAKANIFASQQVQLFFQIISVFFYAVIFQNYLEIGRSPISGSDFKCFRINAYGYSCRVIVIDPDRCGSGLGGHCQDFIDLNFGDFHFPAAGDFSCGHVAAGFGDQFLQRIEFVFREEVGYFRGETEIHVHVLMREIHVGLYRDELMAQPDMWLSFTELRLLAWCQFVNMPIDVLHGAVLRNKFPRTDFADAFHAGHVVGRITAEGKHFNDLYRRGYAVFLAYRLGVQDNVFATDISGLYLIDVFVHQLAVVLVGSDHVDFLALFRLTFRHGADDVVRLEAGHHQCRDAKCLAYSDERFKGVNDKLRGLCTGGLVFRIHLVSERSPRRVERYGDIVWLFSGDQFQNVFGKSEENGHVCALGVDHRAAQEGIIHLEYQRMSIYKE